MKMVIKIYALATVMLLSAGCQEQNSQQALDVGLNTEDEKAGYAIGVYFGNIASKRLKQQDELGLVLERDQVKQGFLDALTDQIKMNEEDVGATLKSFKQKMTTVVQEKAKETLKETVKAAAKYLEDNVKKKGVTVTESGIQYEVIKQGNGPKPTTADTVTVHYTGRLIDGTIFDSSKENGQPATFPLANVIKGWIEGIALMQVGSEYRLTIPAELAYGDKKIGTIPASSVLVFEVELISIEGK